MIEFATAAILAGGASSRMGFDKQYLRGRDRKLIDILLPGLRARFKDVLIITNMPELYAGEDIRVADDIYPHMGPLGGIHSALAHAQSEAVFVMACDMPILDLPYLDYLTSRCRGKNYDACVTGGRNNDRYQAFHSYYYRSALPVIESDLSQGLASVNYLLKKINTLVIPWDEAGQYTTRPDLFRNLNTREEYQRFLDEEE